ncbi:MAG TPA: phosphoribosylamine--glycine ligase [Ktedonobacterales bacterium]
MKILVVGSGGREHALVWKLAQSAHRPHLYAAPGNPGMRSLATLVPVAADDIEGLLSFAREQKIDLTVVGPEVPLMLGIADRFRAAGLRIFGPNRAAAQLEGSKAFAKEVMRRAGIPTAHHATFTDLSAARAYVQREGAPIVIKANGLAAGKGVTVAPTLPEARQALETSMEQRLYGAAGDVVVIEEYLEGDELSVMALVAGERCQLLLSAQDHKQLLDGDQGPNTGGMGAVAPVPWVDSALLEVIRSRVFTPLLAELTRSGVDYRGVLYAGLMITREGPKVLEFNARFGDPETQAVLPLLQSDLVDLCLAVAYGTLEQTPLVHEPGAAIGVVLASAGYPEKPVSGQPITGLEDLPLETLVFHAGTRDQGGQLVTAGGRVLTVVGQGADLEQARARAYNAVERIHFSGKQFRRDIGLRSQRIR